MSDDKQKTLCAHVEEELQVEDPLSQKYRLTVKGRQLTDIGI